MLISVKNNKNQSIVIIASWQLTKQNGKNFTLFILIWPKSHNISNRKLCKSTWFRLIVKNKIIKKIQIFLCSLLEKNIFAARNFYLYSNKIYYATLVFAKIRSSLYVKPYIIYINFEKSLKLIQLHEIFFERCSLNNKQYFPGRVVYYHFHVWDIYKSWIYLRLYHVDFKFPSNIFYIIQLCGSTIRSLEFFVEKFWENRSQFRTASFSKYSVGTDIHELNKCFQTV